MGVALDQSGDQPVQELLRGHLPGGIGLREYGTGVGCGGDGLGHQHDGGSDVLGILHQVQGNALHIAGFLLLHGAVGDEIKEEGCGQGEGDGHGKQDVDPPGQGVFLEEMHAFRFLSGPAWGGGRLWTWCGTEVCGGMARTCP